MHRAVREAVADLKGCGYVPNDSQFDMQVIDGAHHKLALNKRRGAISTVLQQV